MTDDQSLTRYCGAKNRAGNPCRRPAGWGTDHVGQGRCKLHGGASPVKHGMYSKVMRRSVRELQEQYLAEPDPLNALPDLALARANLTDYLNRHREGKIDLRATQEAIDVITKIIERIHRMRNASAISRGAVMHMMHQMAQVVEAAVTEPVCPNCRRAIPDWTQEVLEKIRNGWLALRISAAKG